MHFKNRSINLLNLHMGFFSLGFDVGWIFGPIYFLKLGIPIWLIFLIWSLIFVTRFFARMLSPFWTFRYGVKPMTMIGVLGSACGFLLLMQVQGVDIWLWLYLIVYGTSSAWYWLHFHILYAKAGEAEHRGKHFAIRQILVMKMGFLGPLLSGWLIESYTFSASFFLGIVSLLLSAILLHLAPENPIPRKESFSEAQKDLNWGGFWLFVCNSFGAYPQVMVWQLILFMMLGDTVSFGGLLSSVILVQMICQFFLGSAIDKGKGKILTDVGFAGDFCNTIAKSSVGVDLKSVIPLEVSQSFTRMVRMSLDSVVFYNDSKASRHPYWYQFVAESGWDLGSFVILVLCGVLHYAGVPLRTLMLLGLLGTVGAWWIVRGYYGRRSS